MIGDHTLYGGFGAAIRVGRANGAVLWDRNHVGEASCIAVDGCRRRKDNVGNVVLGHGLEEGYASCNVHTVVLQGDLSGLADSLARDLASHACFEFV